MDNRTRELFNAIDVLVDKLEEKSKELNEIQANCVHDWPKKWKSNNFPVYLENSREVVIISQLIKNCTKCGMTMIKG